MPPDTRASIISSMPWLNASQVWTKCGDARGGTWHRQDGPGGDLCRPGARYSGRLGWARPMYGPLRGGGSLSPHAGGAGAPGPGTRGRLEHTTSGVTPARMLREFAEALEVLTAERPLVLVLEDLHWSDRATVEWLAYVVRRRDPARLPGQVEK